MLNKKKILITGGTGSFGKKFISTTIKNYSPEKIIVYSRDELKQFEMQQRWPDGDLMRYFIGVLINFLPKEPVPPVIKIFFLLSINQFTYLLIF